jgi:protein-S-isoprenylcysteine O-methyltransferase
MKTSIAAVPGLIYVLSEFGLAVNKRAKVAVAIAADHRLIDTGPYRFVRHPSYTGALMAFLGLALCLANWASRVVMVVPVFLVFLRRMQVEEGALLQALGDQYREYMNRTKRLIPAVY